jgi:hypothetical protein
MRKALLAAFAATLVAATNSAFADPGYSRHENRASPSYDRQEMMRGTGSWNMQGGPMGGSDMMQMMRMMQMMNSQRDGMGMGGMPMGMGGMFAAGNVAFVQSLDADDDGQVTSEEFSTGLTAILKNNDRDGNGTLSINEFDPAYAATVRWQMVDQFQALDDNGDGQVTVDEITAAADRAGRMRMRGGRGFGMPMYRDEMRGNQPAVGAPRQQRMQMMDDAGAGEN